MTKTSNSFLLSLDTWRDGVVSPASIVALSAALAFDDGIERKRGRVIWRNDEMKRGLSHSIAGNGVEEDNGENRTIGETANHTQ